MNKIKLIVFKLLLQDFFKENKMPEFKGQVLNKVYNLDDTYRIVNRQKEYDRYQTDKNFLLQKLYNLSK